MSSTLTKSKIELSVHQIEPAIVVCEKLSHDSKQLKIIQLKGLSEHSNSNAVARFVQDQCQSLIPLDKLPELEQLIASIILRERSSEIKVSSFGSADIEKLDDYLELLYEEGESKLRGVSLILQLFYELPASSLPKIVENEPLMSALVRIMKEDARRNFDLAIQVGQAFYRLSQFEPFLTVLSRWKIGLLCLQLVEQELKRSEVWRKKVQELTDSNSRRNWESALIKQDLLITVCLQILLNISEDLRSENKMQRKGLLLLLFNALEHSSSSQLFSVLSHFMENQKIIMIKI
ncbi:Beta-Casp domain-containing protein [Meloidogyne graminicola]|uniref:Beta-Casp domain-containing protein n=1 Tax=Meloidogyne graminicola TaxID=189291 RepID=A0A8S9ZMY4_9BILA|nr:Beta-Casp domain-containing protein [Meloidogyne graminicola]